MTPVENISIMSHSELVAKLKLVRAQTDATIELLSSTATLPFILDDEYEADYLIGCLESNSKKLNSLAKKCGCAAKADTKVLNSETEHCNTDRLLTTSVSSSAEDSRVNQFEHQLAVETVDVDSDETASMGSLSPPICSDSVSKTFMAILSSLGLIAFQVPSQIVVVNEH